MVPDSASVHSRSSCNTCDIFVEDEAAGEWRSEYCRQELLVMGESGLSVDSTTGEVGTLRAVVGG